MGLPWLSEERRLEIRQEIIEAWCCDDIPGDDVIALLDQIEDLLAERKSMDDFTQEAGFRSSAEMQDMIISVDLTNPLIYKYFGRWKLNDGSKQGLQKLLDLQKS